LWQDALKKAPGSIRPYINLARTYQNSGDRRTARALYEQAMNKYSERTKDYRVVLLNNIGEIYFAEGDYNKAIDIWSAAALRVKDHRSLRSNLALAFARKKDWQRAIAELDKLLVKLPDNSQYNFLKGCYLIETGQYDDAISHLRKALLAGYDAPKTLANIGVVYYHKKNYSKAERFLKWASSGKKKTPEMLIWLLAVNLKLADLKDADYYSDEVLKTVSITALHSWFELISDPGHHLYPEKTQIINYLTIKLPRNLEYVAGY
jgi:Tfp pilus assembly protein PilF